MLTLADIDHMFPETHDASVYSDLYKSVYGIRPRGATFESLEAFELSYQDLVESLDIVLDKQKRQQKINVENFEAHINNILQTVQDSTREDAIRFIAQGMEFEHMVDLYGFNVIENELDLPSNYIKDSLA